ncbi:MAG TPA: type II secretion system F family protein [archaeon]|nr:type II secretion system F family protein [archaeon]
MASLDFLKKKIEEKDKKKGEALQKPAQETGHEEEKLEGLDVEKVESIVQKMRRKYQLEGVEYGGLEGSLGELRGIIAEGKTKEIEIQKVEELQEVSSPTVRKIGMLYIKAKRIFSPLSKIVIRMPQMETLSYFLFSANMRYSVKQYVAITVTLSTICALVVFAISGILIGLSWLPLYLKILAPVLLAIWFFFLSVIVIFAVPKQKAKSRGDAISMELPFALRHMSTELHSGMGLYRTLQAIAVSDYGVLSEEFAKTINEVEEGIEIKDALSRLALRTQNKSLRNSLTHMIRALKTGGNLSEIMSTIADDVGFELRMKTRDFAQRMNFFGVIFIFVAIWLPVIMGILGAIRNSVITGNTVSLQSLPLTPVTMSVMYLVVLPALLLMLVIYIKSSQPKV